MQDAVIFITYSYRVLESNIRTWYGVYERISVQYEVYVRIGVDEIRQYVTTKQWLPQKYEAGERKDIKCSFSTQPAQTGHQPFSRGFL